MNIKEFNLKNIEVKEWMILISLISSFTLISGVIVGEKLQSDYFGDMLNNSANTNNLIRTDEHFYYIEPYNIETKNLTQIYDNIIVKNGVD